MPITKGGREKLNILLSPEVAKRLRHEKVDSGEEISAIVEKAVLRSLREREQERQKQTA